MNATAPQLDALAFTIWSSLSNPLGRRRETTWAELLADRWWTQPAQLTDKLQSKGWSPATFAGDKRAKAGVEQVYALVLDYEAVEGETPASVEDALDLWQGLRLLLHTSYSHAPDRPRFRVILPLTRPVTGPEYSLLWRWAASRCAEAGHPIDEACRDPSRLWFLPAIPPGGEASYRVERGAGGDLDVEAALAEQREREAPPPPPPPRPRPSTPSSEAGPERYLDKALEGAADDVRCAPKGSRHNVIRSRAYHLAGFIHTGLISAVQIEETLLAATRAAGWDDEPKTLATIRDQIRAGARAPRPVPEPRHPPRAAASPDDPEPAEAQTPPPSAESEGQGETAPGGDAATNDTDWHTLLISRRGEVTADLANVLAILEHDEAWRGRLRYNEARQQVEVDGARVWQDHDDTDAAVWLQRTWKVRARPEAVCQAVQAIAQKHRCNPLADWLRGLRWDGTPRLDAWLTTYAGAKDDALTRAIGATWLRCAVARALAPGVKADAALILEGTQGAGKSSIFAILGGDYFTDDVPDLGHKDAALAVARAWIVELPELGAMARALIEHTKAFLSRTVDRVRPPYGRALVEWPRRCVFGGTTNRSDWAVDATGNRRFHPVKVGATDLEALRRDREQLLAEAVASWQATGPAGLVLPKDLWATAARQQEARVEGDAWDDAVAKALTNLSEVTVGDLLGRIGVEVARQGERETRRVVRILTRLRWERCQVRREGRRVWVYRPSPLPDPPEPEPEPEEER